MRTTFLSTADAALTLLDALPLAAAWDQPSSLEGMTVGGLAAHLARAVLTVETYLGEPSPAQQTPVVDAAGYLVRGVPDTAPDSEVNRQVLARAEQSGTDGPTAVTDAAWQAVGALRERLPDEPPHRVLAVLDGIAIPLDDYLATRVVELVVHADDLVASVPALSPPELPTTGEALAVRILAEVARRRTSSAAVVRTLARRERAPEEPPRAF